MVGAPLPSETDALPSRSQLRSPSESHLRIALVAGCQGQQGRGDALGLLPQSPARRPRTHNREQTASFDRASPSTKARPALVERAARRCLRPGLLQAASVHAVGPEPRRDRVAAVVPQGNHSAGNDRYGAATPAASVPSNEQHQDAARSPGLHSAPQLSLSDPVPDEPEGAADGMTGPVTVRAPRRPCLLDGWQPQKPALDVDVAMNDPCLAPPLQSSPEHDGRGTAKYTSRHLLCGRRIVDAPPPSPCRTRKHPRQTNSLMVSAVPDGARPSSGRIDSGLQSINQAAR